MAIVQSSSGGRLGAARMVAMLVHQEADHPVSYYMSRLKAAETLPNDPRNEACIVDVAQAVVDIELTVDTLVRHRRLWEMVMNHLAVTGIVTASDARTFQQACHLPVAG